LDDDVPLNISLGAWAAEGVSIAKRPQRSIFHHFLDQHPVIGTAKSSKTCPSLELLFAFDPRCPQAPKIKQ